MNIFGCSNIHIRICCCSCCRFLKSASEYRVALILRRAFVPRDRVPI
jgi:hypothetical protein